MHGALERARRGTGSPRLARALTPTPARRVAHVDGFIIRRLLWTIPVILLVILMTFLMMRQIQGNPFRHSERAVPAEIQANLDAKFDLDEPVVRPVPALREGRRRRSTSGRRSCCATAT